MNYLRIILPVGALLVLAVVFLLWRDAVHTNDTLTARLLVKTQEAERLSKRADDLEREAIERLADDAAIEKLGKGMTDAINATTPAQQTATPSAVSVALGCARLREAGAASDAFKRICGAGQAVAGTKAKTH